MRPTSLARNRARYGLSRAQLVGHSGGSVSRKRLEDKSYSKRQLKQTVHGRHSLPELRGNGPGPDQARREGRCHQQVQAEATRRPLELTFSGGGRKVLGMNQWAGQLRLSL